MSKRKVTLKLTSQKDLIVHESSARTFDELKKELPDVNWKGMRVVERATKNTIQMDDAILPGGDFVLFLVPEKVKAGKGLSKLDNLENASYNDLRSHASFLNKMKNAQIFMNGTTDDLRKAIKNYYNKSETNVEELDPVQVIEDARKKINAAIDTIIENATKEDTTEYVVKTSVQDLENELKDIKNALKL